MALLVGCYEWPHGILIMALRKFLYFYTFEIQNMQINREHLIAFQSVTTSPTSVGRSCLMFGFFLKSTFDENALTILRFVSVAE